MQPPATAVAATLSSNSNPSTPSDNNSINDEKEDEEEEKHHQQKQLRHESDEDAFDECKQEIARVVNDDDDDTNGNTTSYSSQKITDPRGVKRILANRQSAQRSRVRKLQYISELQRSVTSLQAEVSVLSPRVAFLDHQRLLLNVDSSALKQRIAALAQDKIFKDVRVITRYHRDPVGSDGTILGDSQWSWLERELKGPPTAITIIGSSIQVISNLSATLQPLVAMESWGRFPKERYRLFKLIAETKRGGVLFISGDVHFGEITIYATAADYPLFDITSSGLTQSVEDVVPRFLRSLVRFCAWFTPSTMRVKGPNCKYKSCVYGQPNFETIEIDWDSHPVSVKFEIQDKNGVAVTGVNISLLELHPSKSETFDKVKTGDVLHSTNPVQCVERTIQLPRADKDMLSKQEFEVEVGLDFHSL